MSVEGIFANLTFCIPLGITMFLLFVLLRHRIPLFYHRNILCHGKSVLDEGAGQTSFGNWFKRIMTMRDIELLRLGGLDSVVLINALRLILIFFCIISLPCLLLLIPYYYTHSDTSEGVNFTTFTIADLYIETFWPPLIVLIFLTVMMLYGIYSFYSNYITMRQAYLLRPSAMSSLGAILANVEAFGSIKDARRRFDSSTCTVLLHPIPPEIPPKFLKQTLEASGVKGIKSIQFLGDFGVIERIMMKRNSSLMKLESALKTFTENLRESEEISGSLELEQRMNLLNQLKIDSNFCFKFRPRHKTSKPSKQDPEPVDSNGKVDSIRHFYKKMMERENQLQIALKQFNAVPHSRKSLESVMEVVEEIDFEKRYIEETTFISWKKLKNFSLNFSNVAILDCNQAALVHFNDYREACRAQQLLLTSRSNAMESKMAPGIDDINWEFVGWSHRQRWTGALKSNLFYWLLVVAFAPIVTAIVAFIDMKSLGRWIPSIETFRQNHPGVRAILEGFLAPFFSVLLLKRTGVWITQIMKLRGPISKSDLALKVQSAHTFFLFIQIIFIGAIFSNIYEITASSLINNYQLAGLLGHLRETLPKKSHFFFNFLIQDICNELMLELLNPKSLFFDRSFISETSRKQKSIRSLFNHDTIPPKLDSAITWSRFVIFPFFIVMTYIITAPLIIIPAVAYFSIAYFVFRFRYAHYGRVEVETGGLFWRQASQQMIYALIICQFVVFLQYSQFRKDLFPSILLIGLISVTVAFIPFLRIHFGRILNLISVAEDDVKESKKFISELIQGQNMIIPRAVECFENSEIVKSRLESDLFDHLNFRDIDQKTTIQNNPKIEKEEENDKSSSSLLNPYWSIIPLNISEEQAQSSFDPFQVDNFVDLQYVKRQYEHPLILKHTQILMIPSDLPMLLKKKLEK